MHGLFTLGAIEMNICFNQQLLFELYTLYERKKSALALSTFAPEKGLYCWMSFL